jgi:hypothetical protein
MSLLSDRTDLGHEFLEACDPAEIIYLGKTWVGLSGQVTRRRGERKSGGQFSEYTGSVSVRRSVVGSVEIKSGKPIIVDGVKFWVGDVTSDSSAFEITLLPNNSSE